MAQGNRLRGLKLPEVDLKEGIPKVLAQLLLLNSGRSLIQEWVAQITRSLTS